MIRVSLSESEKSIDSIWLWHQRASNALRTRLLEEQTAVAPIANPIFFGLTGQEVAEFFTELDYLSILDLLSATEAALRVDFWTRVHDKHKDPLSRKFRELVHEFEEKISLETHLLDMWVAQQPDLKSRAGDFKGALKLRHWLAHGRYWTPKLARQSYSYADVFDICDRLLRKTGLK